MMKKGFTIVELLMVVTVIAVLLGIVTTAASSAMNSARAKRAGAMRNIVEGGIAAYHRQNDKWPDKIESYAESGETDNGKTKTLSDSEYDAVMQQLLKVSTGAEGKNPVMDPTELMVMRRGTQNGKATPVDFRTAVTETKTLNVSEMTVVYPAGSDGKGYRFKITYNPKSDTVAVGM